MNDDVMIREVWLSFHARGETYQPHLVEYSFKDHVAPGDIATRGKYAGRPTPFGYSEIEVPDEIPIAEKVSYLHREVAPLLAAFKSAGATDFYVSAGYLWKNQCDFSFSEAELKLLSSLGCPLHISCYEDGAPNQS